MRAARKAREQSQLSAVGILKVLAGVSTETARKAFATSQLYGLLHYDDTSGSVELTGAGMRLLAAWERNGITACPYTPEDQ